MIQTGKEASVFSNPLNRTFDWFRGNLLPTIQSSVQEFWSCEVDCRLISIFDNKTNIFKGEEFYVTKVINEKTKDNSFILVKLSKEICSEFLEMTLGKNNFSTFNFDYLTELEYKVLCEFNTAVGKNLFAMTDKEVNLTSETEFFNLIIYLKTKNEISGKMIVSVPKELFTPQEAEIKEFEFDINNFAHSETEVDITVGKSKTNLQELRNLEKDDIVVLEESRLNRMTLHINGKTLPIKVNPDPTLILDETENNEDENMESNLSKDMWDTIQVEIGAEFEKVKISLGELRQISEGLVVDIGSVYKNKIDLTVENRKIATGELVIINDRYGIRIDEVFKQEQIMAQAPQKKKEEQAEENFEEENFEEEENDEDFSDFDVDDEDESEDDI